MQPDTLQILQNAENAVESSEVVSKYASCIDKPEQIAQLVETTTAEPIQAKNISPTNSPMMLPDEQAKEEPSEPRSKQSLQKYTHISVNSQQSESKGLEPGDVSFPMTPITGLIGSKWKGIFEYTCMFSYVQLCTFLVVLRYISLYQMLMRF